MTKIPEEPHWYALTVRPRHEKAAAEGLRLREVEEFLPLYWARRRWSDRVKSIELPLFPGYVFSHFDYRNRVHVLNTPGVVSIVGFGNTCTPVPDQEIAAIQTIIASGLPSQPWPYLRIGQKVRIAEGPLYGLEGTLLREKNVLRVVVTVDLLQRAVAVEVDRDLICAA